MRFSILAAVLCGLAPAALAQPAAPADADTAAYPTVAPRPGLRPAAVAKSEKKLSILPIPVIFYQDETGLGYGLGALLSGRFGQDTANTRPSNVRAQYWTTQKSQSLLQLVHTVFTPGEKFFLNGEISSYDIRLQYFGIGNDTRSEDASQFDYKVFIINQRVQAQVAHKLFAGLQYRYTNTRDITSTEKADNGGTNYFSRDPRLSERERQNTRVSGLGPVLTLDTRDNVLASFTGDYVDLGVTVNGSGLGSDYRFVRYQLDARHFQPIGSNKTILALQYLAQLHTGEVPFRELAGLGANLGGTLYNNANLLRGIYEQRFRDRQMMMLQAELRRKLIWRIDGAVFGGVGQVGYSLSDFSTGGTKVAGGAGIRFNFIRRDRVNLRLDYAVGSGNSSGIYFAIGEAF